MTMWQWIENRILLWHAVVASLVMAVAGSAALYYLVTVR